MSEYDHKGTAITFNAGNAKFEASIGGKLVRTPSLDAMKARIDKSQADGFEPFEALAFSFGGPDFDEVRVTGISREHGTRTRPRSMWIAGNNKRLAEIMSDTPENRQAIEAWRLKRESVESEKDRLDDELYAAYEAIQFIPIPTA